MIDYHLYYVMRINYSITKSFLGLERIVQLSVYDDRSQSLIHLQKYEMFYSNNTWLTFNLTMPVADIISKDHGIAKTLKIVISIASFTPKYKYESKQFKLSLLPIRDDIEHDYPVLLLSYSLTNAGNKKRTEIVSEKRRKRSVEDDYEEETNNLWDDDNIKKSQLKKMRRIKNTCRRKPLYVDFEEIKYDAWIVQPKGYEVRKIIKFLFNKMLFYIIFGHFFLDYYLT